MLLEADGISMTYQKSNRLVLNKIKICADKGEFIVIRGNSGSGKSTLLAILGGYLSPTSGVVKYKGKKLSELKDMELSHLHRNKIGYVPQSNVMLKKYSVFENIMISFRVGEKRKATSNLEERVHMHLRQLEIEELCNRYPYELSGGELKRVSLVRAMLMNPEIIIADEPTTGLDKDNRMIILDYLRAYTQAGNTVIIATHDEFVYQYGNRVLMVNNGNILEDENRVGSIA